MSISNEFLKIKEEFFPEKVSVELFGDLGSPHTVTAKRYRYPFTHISIEQFLPQKDFEVLSNEFKELLARGLGPADTPGKFSRFDTYDLYSFVPQPSLEGPNKFFYSESYFKAMESIFNLKLTRDTLFTYHHHLPSEADNYIHNDYNVHYLVNEPLSNGVNPWYKQCNPGTGSGRNDAQERVRAVAAIFYLNNLEWNEELQGETAIFEDPNGGTLVRKMAPINNNLTAFEITPHSYHRFMKNNSPSRNSIAQWFYVTPEAAEKHFPNNPPRKANKYR